MPWSPGRSNRDRAKPPGWEQARQAVLQRDAHTCTIRGPRCTLTANHVDHTDAAQGPWDIRLEVLRAACQPCHMARTARQAHAARRRPTLITPEDHPNSKNRPC